MPKKTLILFDIGGVLVELNFKEFYKEAARISGKHTKESFKEAYIHSDINRLYLRGEITTKQYQERLERIIGNRIDLVALWKKAYKRPISEMVELKKQLFEAGHAVGIDSNIAKLHVGILKEQMPQVLKTYNPRFPKLLSFERKSAKPENPMYPKLPYSKIIFIDDRPPYIEAAVKHGWKGIVFRGRVDLEEPKQVIDDSKERNIPAAYTMREVKKFLREQGVSW